MKTIGNILWHIPFLGFLSAILYFLLGSLLILTIVAAPIGIGLIEYSKFLFWPFGNAMISKSDLNIDQNKAWKAYSTIVMILYFPLGLISVLIACFQVFFLCCTIVGIPVALVVAKSLGTHLNPVNKKCVSVAVLNELERRSGEAEVEKYLGEKSSDLRNEPVRSNTGVSTTYTPTIRKGFFCPNCGTAASQGASFCGECGIKL